MSQPTEASQWIEQKFLDWQQTQGKWRTMKEFSEHLGIPQSTLTNYIKGNQRPSSEQQ